MPVEVRRYEGMIHAFFALTETFAQARAAIDEAGTALRRAFGTLPA